MPEERLARRIGLFDATMVVMGGIVGSGIFVTPAIVASLTTTSALMVLKIAAIATLVAIGFAGAPSAAVDGPKSGTSFVAALVPVLFSYGGFQTACFVAGEMKDARRDLPRALIAGVLGVVALYAG